MFKPKSHRKADVDAFIMNRFVFAVGAACALIGWITF